MSVERSIPTSRRPARKLAKGGGRATLAAAQATVGNFLRATRERLDLTQAEVADRTRDSPWQLSRAAVSAIERGENFPGLEAMLALSNVLQIDPKELIERARLTAVVPVDISGLDDRELEDRAAQFFWAGDFTSALAVYDAMIQKLALEEHADRNALAERAAGLEVRRATALKRAGALISAIAAAERAIVLASRVLPVQAEAYVVLADLHVQRGHLPLARDAAERATELAQRSTRPKQLGWAWIVRGRVAYLGERYGEAEQAFLEARRLATQHGDTAHLTHVEGNIGMCRLAAGAVDDGRKWIERAVELAREHGQPALEASWLVELGKIALKQRRLADAERLAQAALRVARPRENQLTVFRAEWLRHRIATERRPGASDRRRLALLRGLFPQLDQHEGIDEITEFKIAVLTERRGG